MANPFAAVVRDLQTGAPARPRASVFAGAEFTRLTQDWFTQLLSADRELKGDLRRLRGAARAMVRDNSTAAHYVSMLGDNIVGPHGIRLQARVQNTRGGLNLALNQKIEDAWEEWCEPENASVDGRMSFVDIQRLVIRTLAQDGEPLVRFLDGADNPFNFALQVLDVDMLDETYNATDRQSPTGNEIRMGVEVDRWGKPVAYWLWSEHPYDIPSGTGKRRRVRVDAADILHPFPVLRPGQSRGVTWFAPVMIDTQMLGGYQEAEITAARIGASNMAAVSIDPDHAVGGEFSDTQPMRSSVPMGVEPGRVLRLNPGEQLSSTNFNHPNGAFGSFTKAVQQAIAAGLNVSYPSLSGNLEAINFSSIRAGILSERDFYRAMQVWFARVFHRRVYRRWAPMAALMGFVPASQVKGTEKILWQPRGWKYVEPLNDIQAAILGRRAGLTTLTQQCAEQGGDFEENLRQIAEEDALAKELGVVLSLETAVTAKNADAGDPNDPSKTEGAAPNGPNQQQDGKDGKASARLAVVG